MGLGCFSSAPTKDDLKADNARLRADNIQLLRDQERLLQLNATLRADAQAAKEKAASQAQEVREALEEAQRRFDQLQQECQDIAAEAQKWRDAAAEQAEHHKQQVAAMSERHHAELRKQQMLQASEHQAKVQTLEQRITRYQRDKAKLLDQMQRRDQALYLARQIIDMVDRTGMLGSSTEGGLGSLLADAVAAPPPEPMLPLAAEHTTPAPPQKHHTLRELRHSIQQFTDFSAASPLDASTPSSSHPPQHPPHELLLPAGHDDDFAASPACSSSDGEGVLNPLWRLTACPDRGLDHDTMHEEQEQEGGLAQAMRSTHSSSQHSRCSAPPLPAVAAARSTCSGDSRRSSGASAAGAATAVAVVRAPATAGQRHSEPVLALYGPTTGLVGIGSKGGSKLGAAGRRAGRYTTGSRGSSAGGDAGAGGPGMPAQHLDVVYPDQVVPGLA